MPNDNRHYHFLCMMEGLPATKVFVRGKLKILVGQEPIHGPGTSEWHLSISHPKRLPTYDELKRARYELIPNNVVMIMMFPPAELMVNLHENCFHLYEYLPDPRLVISP